MLPTRVHLHSTTCDHLVDRAQILHLHFQLLQLCRCGTGLHLRLQEDFIDLIVLSSSSRPVAEVITALDSGEDDVAELDSRVLSGYSSEGGELACSKGGDEGLKGVVDLMCLVLLMRVGDLDAFGYGDGGSLEVLDGGKALVKFSHHDLIILIKNFPMKFILYYFDFLNFNQKG